MQEYDNLTVSRRSVLRSGGAVLGIGTTTGPVSAVSLTTDGVLASDGDESDGGPVKSARQIPEADVTELAARMETVEPASLAPDNRTGIGPGAPLFVTRSDAEGVAGCTANFVWRGDDGTTYLGAAGHCFLPDDAEATQSAGGEYDASQVTVKVCIDCTFGGATALSGVRDSVVELGSVAYARQSSDAVELGNDFGLVEVPDDAEQLVEPSMPTFGGPTEEGAVDGGEPICHYGNGVAFGETYATKGRTGVGTANDGGAWIGTLPASPGDSGAAVESCTVSESGFQGVEAAGILTHVTSAGTAGTNTAKAEQMAAQAGIDIEPVLV